MLEGNHSALILAGHGSTQNTESSLPTRRHAEAIAARQLFREVRACFWLEEPRFNEVLSGIQARDIYIVPNFISEGFYTQEILPREFALEGPVTKQSERTIYYCEPVGLHPVMTDLLMAKVRHILDSNQLDPEKVCLFIAGHGTPKNANSTREVYRQVEFIRSRGFLGQVEALFMEEAPFVRDWARVARSNHVVVVPFFIADGLHPAEDIPVMLGMKEAGDKDYPNPASLQGKQLWYTSSIGTDPGMVEIILAQVEKFRKEHGI